MEYKEICAWLRANSSGIYRPAAEAADVIEELIRAREGHFRQAMMNGAAAVEARQEAAALRSAVETVCEGWTLPEGARKTLEAALWAAPNGKAQGRQRDEA